MKYKYLMAFKEITKDEDKGWFSFFNETSSITDCYRQISYLASAPYNSGWSLEDYKAQRCTDFKAYPSCLILRNEE